MGDLEQMRIAELEREQREAEARRRWEFEDLQRTKRDVLEKDFPDEWLEEVEQNKEGSAAGYWRRGPGNYESEATK